MTVLADTPLKRLIRRGRTALTRPEKVIERVRRFSGWRQRAAQAMTMEVPADPLAAYANYREHALRQGLRGPVLFLSFDCDTDLDAPAAIEVLRLLDSLGIRATFAVPGAQLERSAKTYRTIAMRGSEFMNHGHFPHAEWQNDQYVGITFYETMPLETVEADIRKGHETVSNIIGRPPAGFRAPHFGHFKKPHELDLVHRVAQDLGYIYCSTTIPSYGLEHGPAAKVGTLVELPTFGSVSSPTCILDSWTYLSDRKKYALSATYADLFVETVDIVTANQLPALLTWYGDPAHVVGQEPFERAMRHLAKRSVPSVSGTQAAAFGYAN